MIPFRPLLLAAPLLLATGGIAFAEGDSSCVHSSCGQGQTRVIVVPVPVPVVPRHVDPRHVEPRHVEPRHVEPRFVPPPRHHRDHHEPRPRRAWHGYPFYR